MFIKELCKNMGIDIGVHNIIVDYTLHDGTRVHQAMQVLEHGVNVTDAEIVNQVKKSLPAGSRVCTMIELLGDMELWELNALATSPISTAKPRKCIYLDKKLAAEYIAEAVKERGDRRK